MRATKTHCSDLSSNREVLHLRARRRSVSEPDQPLRHEAGTGHDRAAADSLIRLPRAAQVFVVAVSAAGVLVLVQAMPQIGGGHPVLFAVLMAVSLVASMAKIAIPVPGSASSLTACHVIDVATLILCGTDSAVL